MEGLFSTCNTYIVVYHFLKFTTRIHSNTNDCPFLSKITQLYFFKVSQQQNIKRSLQTAYQNKFLEHKYLYKTSWWGKNAVGPLSFKHLTAAMSCCVNASHSKLTTNVTVYNTGMIIYKLTPNAPMSHKTSHTPPQAKILHVISYLDFLDPEDEGSKLLWNVDKYTPKCTASYPRRINSQKFSTLKNPNRKVRFKWK